MNIQMKNKNTRSYSSLLLFSDYERFVVLSAMFKFWLFLLISNILVWLIVVPIMDKNLSLLDRSSRMTIIHRIFAFRHRLESIIIRRSSSISPEMEALNELIGLYYPHLILHEYSTYNDIVMFRHHTRRMLNSLYPSRLSTCTIEQHSFRYDDRSVSVYFIQNGDIIDWKNSNRPLILYFHGGGFVSGDNETYFGFECHLSKSFDMLLIHVDYRLVPEQSLRQTINELIDVYRVLLTIDSHIYQRLIGMGDSSGGLLWIYVLQWLVENKQSVPRTVILHSPWTNLEFNEINTSMTNNFYMSFTMAFALREFIVGMNTDILPMNLNENVFQAFPPLLITTGTRDVFMNEIQTLTNRIKRSGGTVQLDVSRGSMHAFALFHRWLPEARCMQRKVNRWIDEQFHRPLNLSLTSLSPSDVSCQV
jgi:epsilon-lactone hydrolase